MEYNNNIDDIVFDDLPSVETSTDRILINIHIALMRIYDLLLMQLQLADEGEEDVVSEMQNFHRAGGNYFPPGPNDIVIEEEE